MNGYKDLRFLHVSWGDLVEMATIRENAREQQRELCAPIHHVEHPWPPDYNQSGFESVDTYRGIHTGGYYYYNRPSWEIKLKP